MSLTTDPNDPRLTRGVDKEPVEQAKAYLVLSPEERAKGLLRPVRSTYRHVGIAGPTHPLRGLTSREKDLYAGCGYVAFEPYPEVEAKVAGRYWQQLQLDAVGKGCGHETKMNHDLAETYARDPSFYGATYCVHCKKHLPVGADGEFIWLDGSRVGT